jgi:hypothetical protein
MSFPGDFDAFDGIVSQLDDAVIAGVQRIIVQEFLWVIILKDDVLCFLIILDRGEVKLKRGLTMPGGIGTSRQGLFMLGATRQVLGDHAIAKHTLRVSPLFVVEEDRASSCLYEIVEYPLLVISLAFQVLKLHSLVPL